MTRPVIVHALPPSRIKRPEPTQPAQALPVQIVHSPKRGPTLPVILAPYDRYTRADAADRLWQGLVRRVREGEASRKLARVAEREPNTRTGYQVRPGLPVTVVTPG